MQKRIPSIDVAKGIGIILVVLGHNRALKDMAPLLGAGIYLFHMPMFFLLSGLLTTTPFKSAELKSKILGLLRPYLTGVVIFLPLQWLQADHPSNHPLIGNALWGSGNSIYNTPLWFLTCLMAGYSVLWASGRLGLTKRAAIALPFALSCLILTYFSIDQQIGYQSLPKDSLDRPLGAPLNLDLALLCTAFLLLGSKFLPLIKIPPPSSALALVIAASGTFFVFLLLQHDPRLDLNYRLIQHWPAALGCCITGIIFTICLSILISRHSATITRPLEYFGQNTLIILVLHAPIQNHLVRFISKYVDISLSAAILFSLSICLILSWISASIVSPNIHLRKFFYAK